MSSRCEWFETFTPLTTPTHVILGDNSTILGTGTGRILT